MLDRRREGRCWTEWRDEELLNREERGEEMPYRG
jgi:hypothetical protein